MRGITVPRTGNRLWVWLEEPGTRTRVSTSPSTIQCLPGPEGVTRRLVDMEEARAWDGELAD